ncbi:DNA cytosine methyltransferase [Cereibacter azotoformans]|uniref:DNA cytosine methyltransferase n=1 Tax=Cereibacter azotoformans TaxID=43057 RepID=UPI002E26A919
MPSPLILLNMTKNSCTVDHMRPKCIDLFSGCGGLSLGLGAAGFTTEFAVEAHRDAFATYEANLLNRPGTAHHWPHWLEKRAWKAEELLADHRLELSNLQGAIDLIAGGPPCQGFSMNGLRRPDDPRSRMVEVYLEYVEVLRPKFVLIENVPGFRSMRHRTGGTYSEYTARRLDEIGYQTWSDIVRASDWGVPQKRPRFVLIAALKGAIPGVDPIQRLRVSRKAFLHARRLGPGATSTKSALSDLRENGYTLPLDLEWGKQGFRSLVRSAESESSYQDLMRAGCPDQPADLRLPRHRASSIERMREILSTCERGVCLRPFDRERLGIRKRSTTPLDPDSPSPTISTLPDDFIHYEQPRSMTVREHARLQSFPDWFSFCGPYTSGGMQRRDACPKFTQVGNAVPPLLGEALGEMLVGLLRDFATDQVPHFGKCTDVRSEFLTERREI